MTIFTKFSLILGLSLSLSLMLATHHKTASFNIDKLAFVLETQDSESDTELIASLFENKLYVKPRKSTAYGTPGRTGYQQQQAYWAHAPPVSNI